MALSNLSYTKDWSVEDQNSSKYFSTHESNETQVRSDMQLLYNDILTWANNLITALGDCSNIGMGESSTLVATNVKDALMELKNAITAGTVPNYSLGIEQMKRKSVEGVPAVDGDNIANGSITSSELASNSVGTSNIISGAIEHSHLAEYEEVNAANAPVGTKNIQTGAVTNSKLASYTISHNKLATVSNPDGAAVDASNIVYKTITRDRICSNFGAAMTVTSNGGKAILVPDTFLSKVSNAVGTYTFSYNGSSWILGGSTVALIQYGITTAGTFNSGDTIAVVVSATTPAIGTNQIENGSVTNDKLAGGITNAKLAGSISNDKLAGGITNDKLAGSISNSKLAGGITYDKISSVSPSSLTSVVPVSAGGTGANNAASARSNLGVTAGNLGVSLAGNLVVSGNNYILRTGSSGAAGYITFVT